MRGNGVQVWTEAGPRRRQASGAARLRDAVYNLRAQLATMAARFDRMGSHGESRTSAQDLLCHKSYSAKLIHASQSESIGEFRRIPIGRWGEILNHSFHPSKKRNFSQTLSIVRPPAGLGGNLTYSFLKQPLRVNVTLALEWNEGERWIEVDRSHKGVAPPTGEFHVLEVSSDCQSGVYRIWYAIDVEWPNGEIDQVGPLMQDFMVTEQNCMPQSSKRRASARRGK